MQYIWLLFLINKVFEGNLDPTEHVQLVASLFFFESNDAGPFHSTYVVPEQRMEDKTVEFLKFLEEHDQLRYKEDSDPFTLASFRFMVELAKQSLSNVMKGNQI
jgi:hypothetical protein